MEIDLSNRTTEQLKETFEHYPNKLNKYLHQAARKELMKRGKLIKIKAVAPAKDIKEVKKLPIEETDEYKDLKSRTVLELKLIAKKKGIPKYYDMKEDTLIKAILNKE